MEIPAVDTRTIKEQAEVCLFRIIQGANFKEDIQSLQMSKSFQVSSKLIKFASLIDDPGLLRVGGRLQMSTWPFDRRHAILLGKNYLTELLVGHYHQERKHQGVEALLAFLHPHFWIINGRRIVRKVKGACAKCGRYDAMACKEVTAPLPPERAVYGRPFYFCAVDYAGPLLA